MNIKSELSNGVLTLTMNRPDLLNSFNREMALDLQKELENASSNSEVRAIVITGEGRAFCAGQDLQEAISDEGPAIETIVKEHYNPIILKIREIEKPIIAKVNGVAAGAGANIALACDVVIATEKASFIQAFSQIGLIPDSGGTYFLPKLIGQAKATALMFTAEKISAEEAEKLGMIYKFVDHESLDEEVNKFAGKIAQMPTKALGLTKELVNASWNNSLKDQLNMEMDKQAEAGNSYDYKEGVNAFLEKRKPEFKGE